MPSDSDPGCGEGGRGRHDAARPAGALPLTISRVEWEPGRAGAVRLRVQGRWTTTSRAFSAPRLVVEHAGRVRRLRPVPTAAWAREALAADEYRGVFSVPTLGAGEPPQRLVLEIGGVTISLPEPRPAAVSEVPYARNTAGAPQERLERDAAEAATLRERLLHDAAQAAMLHDRLERETLEVSALRERLEAAAVDTVTQRERFEREAAGLAAERERLARETAVALARREALGGAEPQAHDAGAMAAAAQRRVDRVEGMLHELAQRMTTVERAARDE